LWIRRQREKLKNVRVAVGVGGAFDFIARKIRRAPDWMQRFGLEWLFRLVLQPWRVRRQWALVVFTIQILRQGKVNSIKKLETA
jgi:N-acetylglucosaminyldiphosphoundecaprenol N-acetyl-beta-D-mannosaminyltransferase